MDSRSGGGPDAAAEDGTAVDTTAEDATAEDGTAELCRKGWTVRRNHLTLTLLWTLRRNGRAEQLVTTPISIVKVMITVLAVEHIVIKQSINYREILRCIIEFS